MYVFGVICLVAAAAALPTPEELHTNLPSIPPPPALPSENHDEQIPIRPPVLESIALDSAEKDSKLKESEESKQEFNSKESKPEDSKDFEKPSFGPQEEQKYESKEQKREDGYPKEEEKGPQFEVIVGNGDEVYPGPSAPVQVIMDNDVKQSFISGVFDWIFNKLPIPKPSLPWIFRPRSGFKDEPIYIVEVIHEVPE